VSTPVEFFVPDGVTAIQFLYCVAGTLSLSTPHACHGGTGPLLAWTALTEQPTTTPRVTVAGTVSTFMELSLDGETIKDTTEQNVDHTADTWVGEHTLVFTCGGSNCSADVTIGASGDFVVSPDSVTITEGDLSDGDVKAVVFAITGG
jgi:hypothetical protein